MKSVTTISTSTSATQAGQAEPVATPVAVATLDLGVGGMTCASCVSRVERALARVPGVEQATGWVKKQAEGA